MSRVQIGVLLAALLLTSCDHHRPAPLATADSDQAALAPHSAKAGKSPVYPRAYPVALPANLPVVAAHPTPTTNSAPLTAAAVPPPLPPPAEGFVPPPPVAPTTATDSPPPPTLTSTLPLPAETNSDLVHSDMIPPTPALPPPPVMDEDEAKKQVVVLDTSLGRIVIQLDDIYAPRTCGNFRKLVADGFYNHTTFHRVIPNFMIQGGDPNSKSDDRATYGQGDPGYTLPAEIRLKHIAGAVAMARLPDSVNPQRDSNGSQFFICVTTCPSLDDQYTVFGHVVQGLDVAVKIANQPRDDRDNPTARIEMEATLEAKKIAIEGTPSTP